MLRFIFATGLLMALASAATAEDSCDASGSTPTKDDDCVRICTIFYCVPTGPVTGTGTGPGPGPFMPAGPGDFDMDQQLKLLFNRDQSLSIR